MVCCDYRENKWTYFLCGQNFERDVEQCVNVNFFADMSKVHAKQPKALPTSSRQVKALSTSSGYKFNLCRELGH